VSLDLLIADGIDLAPAAPSSSAGLGLRGVGGRAEGWIALTNSDSSVRFAGFAGKTTKAQKR
jgi:hypothetical protein